ncbi:MAG: hypothetical protein M1524_02860 [Patescibacteria group bacterium]|nr:hypothetical protein [Patescibacteria group bacterium]
MASIIGVKRGVSGVVFDNKNPMSEQVREVVPPHLVRHHEQGGTVIYDLAGNGFPLGK